MRRRCLTRWKSLVRIQCRPLTYDKSKGPELGMVQTWVKLCRAMWAASSHATFVTKSPFALIGSNLCVAECYLQMPKVDPCPELLPRFWPRHEEEGPVVVST